MKFTLLLSFVFSAPFSETCDWPGHCLGEPCEFYDVDGNGCANDYLCDEQSMLCVENPFTSQEQCSWPGHCLNDSCSTDDDCDSNLVCVSSTPVQETTQVVDLTTQVQETTQVVVNSVPTTQVVVNSVPTTQVVVNSVPTTQVVVNSVQPQETIFYTSCFVVTSPTLTIQSAVCDWPGHCLGEPCEFYDIMDNGCANNLVCDQQTMLCVNP